MSTLSNAISHLVWIVAVGSILAYAGVIASVVRRHRPDAWIGLFAWALAALASAGIGTILWRVWVPRAVESGDYLTAITTVNAFEIGFQVITTILFVRGIVMLAQPPKPLVIDTEQPYR